MDGIWLPLTLEQMQRIADGEVVVIDLEGEDEEPPTRVFLKRRTRDDQ